MQDFFSSAPGRAILVTASLLLVSVIGYRLWAGRITPAKIAAGKELFEHEWTAGDPLAGKGDGLGPVFNDVSCVACHFQGGTGGAGPNSANVNKFTVLPTSSRPEVIRGVIHKNAIAESMLEELADVEAKYPVIAGRTTMDGCYESRQPDFKPVLTTSINTPALFGLGLIEQIPGYSIAYHGTSKSMNAIAGELIGKFDSKGIGRVRMDGTNVGKFGWKGEFGTIEQFVAEACAVEIGLTVPGRGQDLPGEFTEDPGAKYDMSRKQLHEMVCFVKSLPRPEQIMPADPVERSVVENGAKVFEQVGCADCHVPDIGGVSGIYSDFHLYRLASPRSGGYDSDLTNENVQFPLSETLPDEWKTPPLWGVADTAPYMHDGSAPTLESAIHMHRRDADYSRLEYESASAVDRAALIEFLKTLRAPQDSVAESK